MRKSLFCGLMLVFAASIDVARAESVVPGEEHCVVNVRSDDRLNIRSAPRADASVVARKRYGTCGIRVVGECRGNWCPVRDDGGRGWVNGCFLAVVSPSLYCVAGVARGDSLNLRAWPSSQSRVLARLARNQCDIAFLPFATGNWQKIRVDGQEGWVNRQYLSGQ